MKNSHPIIKNKIIPVIMSAKDWLSPNAVDISEAPRSKNTIKKLVNIMVMGLNFASHETMTAVKPCPPAIVVVTVWFMPPTSNKPTIPQMAPDKSMVLTMIFGTFMPTYLAVRTLSPTTDISYPCFV